MLHGRSSQRGILFADTDVEGENAVYCCYQGDRIECLSGTFEDLKELFQSEKDADKAPDFSKRITRIVLGVLAFMVAVVVLAALFGGSAHAAAGAALFAAAGAFPLISFAVSSTHGFISDEVFSQFKRNHGAEHAVWGYRRKHGAPPAADCLIEELRACSHLDPECGTVYMASLLLWAAIAGVAVANLPALGVLKTAGVLVGAAVLLVLNTWLNPLNPLRLAQLHMVAKPGDRELLMAAAGLREFYRLVGETSASESDEAS